MGGRLKGEGTDVHTRLIHVVAQQKPTQHCKASNHPPIRKMEEQWRGGVPSMLSSGGANKSKKNPARLSRVSANEAGKMLWSRQDSNEAFWKQILLYVST